MCSATSGSDTLSWARLGAAEVTGVDFSDPAIAFARELAVETGLADRARFVVSDVYDLPGPIAEETFDVVYTGRGALGWLPDLGPWARAVAGFVRPGGIFFIHEGHPVLWALDDEQPAGELRLEYDYWGGETITFPVEGSYADPTADVDAEVEHGWNHSLGEVVTALADERTGDRAPRREARAGLARAVPVRPRRRDLRLAGGHGRQPCP